MTRSPMAIRPIQSFVLRGIAAMVFLQFLLGQAHAQPQPAIIPKTPPPPPVQTGIGYFRELLSATPAERERLLAGKDSHYRQVLESGLSRYDAYPTEERELRLRSMELRYHVTVLLREPLRNRATRLMMVPENDRPLVEERLKYWDQLSAAEQKEALENERMTRDVFGISGPPMPRQLQLNRHTSNQVVRIEQQLARWQILPDSRRAEIQKNFTTLFEFSDAEKAKQRLQALPLTTEERELMENTMAEFKKLTPAARDLCVRNFPKFAELSPQERRQFLVNAQEWQKMPPEDRETWRRLVRKVPRLPPLPPGLGQPPLPRRVPASAQIEVTNR